jgi:hypothetical protein
MCSSVATLIDRVRAEFVEMPGLELTLPQAARLWNLTLDDSRSILDVLTTAGFLRWTASRTVVRTGRDLVVARVPVPSDISVGPSRSGDNLVWAD